MPDKKEEDEKTSPDSSTEDNSPTEGDETSEQDETAKEQGDKTIPYARFKEVNEEKKTLQEKLKKLEQESSKKKKPKVHVSPEDEDVSKVIEIQRAVKNLEDDEIEELKLRAKAKGVSLSECRKDENFNVWLKAKRQKVKEQSKDLKPSTKQTSVKKSPKDVKAGDLKDMSTEERKDYFNAIGAGGLSTKRKKAEE